MSLMWLQETFSATVSLAHCGSLVDCAHSRMCLAELLGGSGGWIRREWRRLRKGKKMSLSDKSGCFQSFSQGHSPI